MHLSDLQKFILVRAFQENTAQYPRTRLLSYYQAAQRKNVPGVSLQVKIITKSIERLIERELLIGLGIRTPHKWFIREIQLTSKGKRVARTVYENRQLPLPFQKSRRRRINDHEYRKESKK